MHLLEEILHLQKLGKPAGIFSCCSANAYVLDAVFERSRAHGTPIFIESTANQVNQFGGYTGMKPTDFYDYVMTKAIRAGITKEQIVLGGDHLGPLTWSHLDESQAMCSAEELVRQYVLAGFTKIHLDTSMRLGSDLVTERLPDEVVARRGMRLCMIAEAAYRQRLQEHPDAEAPVYVIGSEVPIPGGAQEAEKAAKVTLPEDCVRTYRVFKETFLNAGLMDAWQRVIGMVVQVGVEFSDTDIFEYDREKQKPLKEILKTLPIVFEGHSTDYQDRSKLKEMVEDGVAILKVGPALTFAYREALISMESIEKELYEGTGIFLSGFRAVLEYEMLADSKNWGKYYHGDGNEQKFGRCFGLSDRARYYLSVPNVDASINRLISNLCKRSIPNTLLSQYMPVQYAKVRSGQLSADPATLIRDRIGECIDQYLYATIG
ncbi:MAG: class II D-tagatose-bisphosphate aldolase, non-catalytic subunit, partial [Synergistaceae bacterium]|nr:class II D-tagatose-bisphosphate aldolase, non-catalytic subunit [Synergistaceae bacterium]